MDKKLLSKKELAESLDLHFVHLRQMEAFVKGHPELTEPTSYLLESVSLPVVIGRIEAVKAKSNFQAFSNFLSAVETAVAELGKLRISLDRSRRPLPHE